MTSETQEQYVLRIFRTIKNNPTAANLDELVEAHAQIGYYAATAESAAEMAEAQRKYEEATAAAKIREDALVAARKITADTVTAKVLVDTFEFKKAEIVAYEKARKLKNLLESIEQAVNAIKFLGRYDYSGPTGDRLPR